MVIIDLFDNLEAKQEFPINEIEQSRKVLKYNSVHQHSL